MSKIVNICNYLIKNSKITISSTFLPWGWGLGHAALPPIKTTTF
jgi:hypothetical protein